MISDWLNRNNGPDLASMLPEEIMLGAVVPSKSAPTLNFLSLFTKAFIHRQKLFFGGNLGLTGWLGELKKKLRIEEYIYRRSGKAIGFAKWEKVLRVLG